MSEAVRVFLGWDAQILPRAARWILEAHAEGLADVGVVVPGRRSGRLLLAHLAAAAGCIVPPRVVTPGALPELLYRPRAALATARERVLAWCAALEGAAPGTWPGAGPASDFGARLALARDLVRAQDDLGAEGLRLADVVDRAAPVLAGVGDVERWQSLAELEGEVRRRLEGAGRADPTASRREALARAPADGGRGPAVVLCCLATLASVERELLARYASRVTALVAAPEHEGALFDGWGSVDPPAWSRRQVTLSQGALIVVGRPRNQAAAVARRVVDALAARAGTRGGDTHRRPGDQGQRVRSLAAADVERSGVTVGLVDADLAGVVGDALADRGVAVHDAVGRPLASSAPWRLLAAVGRYLESRSTRDLAALFRHPDLEPRLDAAIAAAVAAAPPAASRDLRDALAARDWLTALDLYTGETLLDTVASPLPGDPAGAAVVAAADAALAAELDGGAPTAPLAEWTQWIHRFVIEVYGDRTLRDDSPDRALGRALHRLGDELREQAEAARAGAGGPSVRVADAIEVLLSEVAGEPLAGHDGDSGKSAAVEMVGWLELALDDAPDAIVAGLDEGAASAAAVDGLLGPALRRSLGLPDADTRNARDLFFLELLSRSRRVTFITGRRGAQGEPLAPRRILLAGTTAALVDTVRAFWGDENDDDDENRRRASGRGRFGPILPTADAPIPTRLPATAFRDYLACPYRFHLRHVLGLRPVRDLPRELQPGDFGRLLHAVLGRFARGPAAASDDAETVARTLEALLSEEGRLRSGSAPRVAVRIQLEQLRRRLRSFARWQAEQARAGWRIVPELTEMRLEAALEVDGETFVVTGRVDRVDRHPTAGRRLLDYKSAEQAATPEQAHRSGPRDGRRWIDLQLPLYERMLRQRGIEGDLRLGFVNLGHRLGDDPLALAEWSGAELADAMATAAGVVRAIRARRFWPPGEPPSYADGFEGLAGDAFPDRARYLGDD